MILVGCSWMVDMCLLLTIFILIAFAVGGIVPGAVVQNSDCDLVTCYD